jgi:hypothetical protein
MATTTPAASSNHDQQPELGLAVTVQLAVQGRAITRQRGSTSPPDDPCDPAA